MGIKGLRSALTNQLRDGHVKEFAGKRIACDGFAWLHRGAFACALQLATGQPTTRHIDYCLHMVKMMRHHKVIPIVVLVSIPFKPCSVDRDIVSDASHVQDGAGLPGKAETNAERTKRRKTQEANGRELFEQGDVLGATKCFQQSIRITAEIAYELHVRLREEGFECIIAPYEADAQLAFLARHKHASAIVTEDSDLIPYGVDTVLYKMDRYGNCSILDKKSILGNGEPALNIAPLSRTQRIHLCILAGCDYLPSVPGVGIKSAFALIEKHKDGYEAIRQLRKPPRKKGKKAHAVPEKYEEAFRRAELTFLCHRVYDPALRRVVHLDAVPDDCRDDLAALLGPPIPDELASRLCVDGALNPHTLEPFQQRQPKPHPRAGSHGASTTAPSKPKPFKRIGQRQALLPKDKNQPVIAGLLAAAAARLPSALLEIASAPAASPQASLAAPHRRDDDDDDDDAFARQQRTSQPAHAGSSAQAVSRFAGLKPAFSGRASPFSIKSWFANAPPKSKPPCSSQQDAAELPAPTSPPRRSSAAPDSGGGGGGEEWGCEGGVEAEGEARAARGGVRGGEAARGDARTPATQHKKRQRCGGPLDAFFSVLVDAPETPGKRRRGAEQRQIGQAKEEEEGVAGAGRECEAQAGGGGEGGEEGHVEEGDGGAGGEGSARKLIAAIDLTLSPQSAPREEAAGRGGAEGERGARGAKRALASVEVRRGGSGAVKRRRSGPLDAFAVPSTALR